MEAKGIVKAITGADTSGPPDNTCHNFRDTGTCRFGDSCKYTHGPQDTRKKKKGSNSEGGANRKKKHSKSSTQPEGSRKVTADD